MIVKVQLPLNDPTAACLVYNESSANYPGTRPASCARRRKHISRHGTSGANPIGAKISRGPGI
jgi:hypothetical protein